MMQCHRETDFQKHIYQPHIVFTFYSVEDLLMGETVSNVVRR